MTCAACVRRVEKALKNVPGVEGANVNLAVNRATVAFDPARTSARELAEAVTKAGYSVPEVADAESEEQGDHAAELARVIAEAEAEEDRRLRRDLVAAAALALPLLVLGMSHGAIEAANSTFGRWFQLVLGTAVVVGPGRRFFRLAWVALRHRATDMNTLVALGTGSAWLYSALAVVTPGLFSAHAEHGQLPHLYFEAAGAIIAFLLLGKLLETRARRHLADAVRGLVALQPKIARRLTGDREEEIPIEKLRVGDRVLVRPGERVPTDGDVVRGTSAIDASMLTGESMPIDVAPGSKVYGGTQNQSGAITLSVTKTGKGTALARIIEAVEQAQASRAPIARLADEVAAVFVPVVLAIAAIAFGAWLFVDPTTAGFATAVERFVAVLVIACPCALGLATPAAVAVGTGRGAELGILVKGGAALEAASRIDTVLLDKTGTLTSGKPTLADVVPVGAISEAELLRLVASAEQPSEHPVARSIVDGARARGVTLSPAERFVSEAGAGIEALVGDRRVRVGNAGWLAKAGLDTSAVVREGERLAAHGRTVAFVAVDGAVAGVVAVYDPPTEDAKRALAALRALGVEVAMVTGDREEAARAIAEELGVAQVYAGVRPEQKAELVAKLRDAGKIVAMVGDGINDAPALAAAHVGVAIGGGTDIAAAAADVALLKGGIGQLPQALGLARATLRTIRQNLFWAFIYNVIGIPIAAGLLYHWTGWLLSPVIASAAMSMSSVSVLASSLRLRRY
ncbi:heavy metal translocating P-type ATPase [Myxococcota bacterium]|nr:heavy metal translocating P-type ATPase [Myxococcota bacterium]